MEEGNCNHNILYEFSIKEKQEFEKVTYREERIIGWDGHQTGILEDK